MMNHLSQMDRDCHVGHRDDCGFGGICVRKRRGPSQDASLSAEDHGNSPQNENYPKRINAQETPEKSTTAAGSLEITC